MSLNFVKLSAPWCPSCVTLGKEIYPKLIEENSDVVFQDINVDEQPNWIPKYSLKSLPTVLLLKNDNEVGRLVGLQSLEKYQEIINQLK